MLFDIIYLFLSFLHVSLQDFVGLWLDQVVPSLLLRNGSTKTPVDLWLEAVLLLIILLCLVVELHALVGGWRTASLNVLLHIVRHCWVIKLALNMVVHIFAWVSLLRLWRLFTRFLWLLLLCKCVVCLLAVS